MEPSPAPTSPDDSWAATRHLMLLSCRPKALLLALGALLGLIVFGLNAYQKQDLPPNVVLIVIDTLRADRLAPYGFETDTAPFLSHLAELGVVCDPAYSTSSWTAPAMASLMTSMHPLQHGVERGFVASQEKAEKGQPIELDSLVEPLGQSK